MGGVDLAGEQTVPLAGAGAPHVAEFAPEELAAALGISPDAGRQLVADALELRHRLPRMWECVQAGLVPVWKARRVADLTVGYSQSLADQVDRALMGRAPELSPAHLCEMSLRALERWVREIEYREHPDAAAAAEEAALAKRGVWLDHRDSTATTRISLTTDTVDALAFDDALTDVASALARLGDTDSLDVRRARAVGILAAPQAALDLFDRAGGDSSCIRPMVYLHLAASDLERSLPGQGGQARPATGQVEKLGAATLDLLGAWLGRTGADDRITVRPVIDLDATAGTDSHAPPAWMREAAVLRDETCVFPGCNRDSRHCDLDHVDPFDPDGPSGQTNLQNLAPLCRRHHRLKTHGRWRYRRLPDGYEWTSPTGRTYESEARPRYRPRSA